MIDTDAARLRADFLARLDDAMRTLPHGVASEIRSGITEELDGLDAEATTARIASLGDPRDIAREAQDEVPTPPVVVVAPPVAATGSSRRPATGTRGFAIAAALTLSFGGIVLPFLGWIVGAVLVCFSTLWRTGEKIVAILVPLVTASIALVVINSFSFGSGSSESTGTGPVEAVNPLLPSGYDLIWTAVLIIGILLVPASGLWLLWRLRGRTER